MNDITEEEKQKNLLKLVLSEHESGKVVVATHEGLMTIPIADIINQPADGILYDLNRLEECIQFDNPRCVNDFACAKVIRALKAEIERLNERQVSM